MINKWYLQRMINIIPKYPQSIHQQQVFKKIETELKNDGKEIPRTLDAIIRGVYNENCEGYSAFSKRAADTQPIFKTQNIGSGYWSMHPDYIPVEPFSLDDF